MKKLLTLGLLLFFITAGQAQDVDRIFGWGEYQLVVDTFIEDPHSWTATQDFDSTHTNDADIDTATVDTMHVNDANADTLHANNIFGIDFDDTNSLAVTGDGSITLTKAFTLLNPDADGWEIDTIVTTGWEDGDFIYLKLGGGNSESILFIDEEAGTTTNLKLDGNRNLNHQQKLFQLVKYGDDWFEMAWQNLNVWGDGEDNQLSKKFVETFFTKDFTATQSINVFTDDAVGIGTEGTEPDSVFSHDFVGDIYTFNTSVNGANANAGALLNEAASTTNPTIMPDKTDETSGLGYAETNQFSLIAGGVEAVRVSEGNGETASVFGANVVETIADATTAGDATLTKAGENFDVTCSVGDVVLVYGGTTAGDYGLYVVQTVTSATVLTVDRAFTGSDADVDFVVLADGVTIENSTNPGITRLTVPSGSGLAPSVAFGDGNTGFWESNDNEINITLNGVTKYRWRTGEFSGINGAGYPWILNSAASATAPIYVFNGDLNTGIGRASTDSLSLIAGGIEGLRIAEGAGTNSIIVSTQGDMDVTGTLSATNYGSDASVSDPELLYINTLSSNAQDQLDALTTKTGQVFTVNAFQYPVPGTEWSPTLSGADCPASQTAVLCWIPLNFLKIGDEITSYSIVGDATETNALTLDCQIYRINKADPLTQTALTNGAMTQVDAGGNFDVVVNMDDETVATDKQYVLQLTATTGVGDLITVMGAEVTINRK